MPEKKVRGECIVLFTCNAWKNWNSMHLVGIFTSNQKLFQALHKLLKTGQITNGTGLDVHPESMGIREINLMDYVYVERWIINKLQES